MMNFKLDTINIIIFSVMFINSTYGIFVYFRNRKDNINLSFFILTLTISAWGITMFGYRGLLDHSSVLWMSRLLYFTAIMIPTAFIYFVTIFPNHRIKLNNYYKYLVPLPMIILCAVSIIPGLLIRDVVLYTNKETFIVFNQWLHLLFGVYVISYFSWAYSIVLKKYFKSYDSLKTQLGYIFIGTLGSTVITLVTNLTLLYFGNFSFNWAGQVGIIFMITFIFYSITHHKLFNIRLVASQLITFLLCTVILIRIFLATNQREILLEIILLIIAIIFGILLIRSALHEIKQREKIEKLATELSSLNSHLSEKVAEQTLEIRKSYELEKKARRDLEKLNETKNQFIMITQHNIRAPITNIRLEIESILLNNNNEISEDVRKTLNDTQTSVSSLTRIVDDFLNIATLKVGSQILNISTESLKPLLESVLHELRIDLESFHITVDYLEDPHEWPKIKIDKNKIREVLLIIIENAVKYNKDHGKILIKNSIKNNIFEITIENTGVGITKDEKNNLFNKQFYRSKRVQIKNPTGMGIGLSVARAIIMAHHGSIDIASNGENHGATVTLSLPFDFIDAI